jgi:alkaline phosphatase
MEAKLKRTRWRATFIIVLFLAALFVIHCAAGDNYPKNIILFIGDGMGVAQITAAKIVQGKLNLERFSVTGLATTYSENNLITESAAASTALATGHKTDNRAIAVSADNEPLKTLFEYAQQQDKSTGMVVTSSVTDATPAAFVAHTADRGNQADIAEQIVNSGTDVLIGGGWSYFIPESNEGSRRKDKKNLLTTLESKMPVVLSRDKLTPHAKQEKLAALLAPVGLPKAAERDYTLAELTETAIGILSKNRHGFVLLVEGSQIDWAGHDQDQREIISEMIDFDGAVGAGLDFARQNGNTLIVVTADHETGGFAIHDGSMETRQVTSSAFTTTGHTATMVPVFVYGPGSRTFSGIQDNARTGQTLIDLLLGRETRN